MKYRLKHRLEYGALRGLSGVVNALPYRAALALGWCVAALAFALSSKIRTRGMRRLRQVFGGTRSAADLRRIAWTSWRNLVFNAVESLRTPSLTVEWLRKVVQDDGLDRIRDHLKTGKGIVLGIPHMGNWELAAVGVPLFGVPMTGIVRRQKNPLTDAYLERMRKYTGLEVLMADAKSFAGCIKRLREGRVVAILPDLRAKARAVHVRFLGVETDVPAGMALFAREAGVPIVPGCAFRVGWARHRWAVFDPIRPDPAADRDADIARMTQAVMDVLTGIIRENPEQYFWYNKRWVLGEE